MTADPAHDPAPAPGLALTPALGSALARLDAGLAALEAAAERRLEAARAQAELGEAFAAMQDDRSRLALELDDSLARGKKLESAGEDVARRLDRLGAALAAMSASAREV